MAGQRNILFTFDYELFLGKKSGSIENCVIEPTQRILNILAPHKALAVFFVDSAWLLRLREIAATNPKAKNDYDKVAQQLQQLVKSGHYVFNHLHPHWLDAKYLEDKNQWDLSSHSRYRFNSLNTIERERLFTQTTELLKEILEPAKPGYIADAYRAGGWSIQPFEDFAPRFKQHGVKYDFSVMPGMKSNTTAQQYDFSSVTIKEPYQFSDSPALPSNGEFAEFPISTINHSAPTEFFNKILLKYLWKTNDRYYGDGMGTTAEITGENSRIGEMVSIELLTSVKLPSYLKFLEGNRYMQFISHPKMLSEHNINTFVRFMNKAFATYTIETDFRKMLPK